MTPEIISLTQSAAHARHGSNIGQPLTRRDGILKVTGSARFAADQHPPGMLYAVLAVSSIARGRVTFLDVPAAKRHPGVVDVMTPKHKPPLAMDPDTRTGPFPMRLDLLQNDEVRYANQPIAVVIAETLEAATEGAALLAPKYQTLPARIGLDASESFVPSAVGIGNPSEIRRGDVEAGLGAASKRIGADGDGVLTAIDHRAKTVSSTFDDFFEPAADASHTLYASPAISTSHEAVRVDIGTPLFMRAPGEATGSIVLESAIDEAAFACGIDPLAFRLKNYAEVEPISGKPFSSKALRECYAQGAA